MRPEAVVVAQILEHHGARPEFHIRRSNSGALFDSHGRLVRFGLPGSGDLEGFLAPRGRFFSAECKTSIGKQRDLQKNYEAMVLGRGGLYFLVRSEAHFAYEIAAAIERERELTKRLSEVLT
jgi:hypothetical protein